MCDFKIIYFLSNNLAPKMRVRTNRTTKIKNRTFAIPAAPAEIPVNPKRPAMIATTKNIKAQRNIIFDLRFLFNYT
jgi:hypothetical protein